MMAGTAVVTVVRIEDYPGKVGQPDLWEIWGQAHTPAPRGYLHAWTYYTTDPTVADTARQARATGRPLTIDWQRDGHGHVILGCEMGA